MKRGEIWFAALDPTIGNEIRKRRPVVIVSNDANNRAARVITVVPLSSKVDKVYPFEVFLEAHCTGLARDSKASAQQIRTISKLRLTGTRAGLVPPDLMRALNDAMRRHLGLL